MIDLFLSLQGYLLLIVSVTLAMVLVIQTFRVNTLRGFTRRTYAELNDLTKRLDKLERQHVPIHRLHSDLAERVDKLENRVCCGGDPAIVVDHDRIADIEEEVK